MKKIQTLTGYLSVFIGTLTGFYLPQTIQMSTLWSIRSNIWLTALFLIFLLLSGIRIVKEYIHEIRNSSKLSATKLVIYSFVTGLGFGLLGLFLMGLVISLVQFFM